MCIQLLLQNSILCLQCKFSSKSVCDLIRLPTQYAIVSANVSPLHIVNTSMGIQAVVCHEVHHSWVKLKMNSFIKQQKLLTPLQSDKKGYTL